MSNWAEDDDGYCTSAADFQDARRVCEELGIPLHRASFATEYRERVFAHFLAELEAGRTPNPDVLCNREVKFGVGLDYAQAPRRGALRDRPLRAHRRRPAGCCAASIADKDQSYFLHALDAAAARALRVPGRRPAQARGAAHRPRARPAGRRTSAIRPASASSASARSATSSAAGCRAGRAPIETPRRRRHRPPPRPRALHARPAQRARHRRAPGAAEAPWFVAAKDLARNALVVVQGGGPSRRCIARACARSRRTGSRARRPAQPSTARRRCAIASRTSPAASRGRRTASTCASTSRCAARRPASTSSSTTARSASAGPL